MSSRICLILEIIHCMRFHMRNKMKFPLLLLYYINTNSERKKNNYSQLLEDLKSRYKKVKFINLSMGALGIYGDTCFNLKSVLKHLDVNENEVNYLIRKLCNICIQVTYFIFCKRNKAWDHPARYHGNFDTLSLH